MIGKSQITNYIFWRFHQTNAAECFLELRAVSLFLVYHGAVDCTTVAVVQWYNNSSTVVEWIMVIPFRLLGATASLLGCVLAIFVSVLPSSGVGVGSFLFGRTDVGDQQEGHDSAAAVSNRRTLHLNSNGFSGRERTKARIAFLIMASADDAGRLHLLLPEIYHPDNIYLVHVDAKTPPGKVQPVVVRNQTLVL